MYKKTDECLFLIAEKGKWGIGKLLKPYFPVYNGAGWFIEKKYQDQIEQISQQANITLVKWPLNGESFTELKLRHKKDFFYTNVVKLKFEIDALKAKLGIYDLDTEIREEERKKLELIPGGKQLIKCIDEYERFQEQLKRVEEEEKIANISIENNILQIVSMDDRIDSYDKMLALYRGKKYLGLRVKIIEEFNESLKGLRKLILLAAAPAVGKTALTIQLALEILLVEKDACLVYLSLEMSEEEIFTRMHLYLAGLDFDTFVLGNNQSGSNEEPLFSKDTLEKIKEATAKLKQIGNRLQIIDSSTCSDLTSDIIIDYIEKLKKQTKCSRAIVIVDYLQVWPTPKNMSFASDTETDKWRIGEIKKIKDATNKVNQDPVIVISESRKPTSGDKWGESLSDVMGSVRGTYTPDVVMLFSKISPKAIEKIWDNKNMPPLPKSEESEDISDEECKKGNTIISFLAHNGIAICRLKVPKCRDGMSRFSLLLSFYFHKNIFRYINWGEIKNLVDKCINNSEG